MNRFLTLAALAVALPVLAHDMPAPMPSNAEFDKLKALAGKWSGAAPDQKEPFTVEWSVTSGGNAAVETLFKGTPHEMVTVYYPEGGKVGMTHYCMAPNRPVMKVKKSSADALEFEADMKRSGIKPAEEHMHALAVKFKDKDHVAETWVSWKDGKPTRTSVLELTRVP